MNRNNEKYRFIEVYGTLALDIASIIISYYLAYYLRFKAAFGLWKSVNAGDMPSELAAEVFVLFLLVCLFYNFLMGGYEKVGRRGALVEATQVLRYTVCMLAGVTLVTYMSKQGYTISRLFIAYFLCAHIVVDYGIRQLYKMYLAKIYKESAGSEKFMVVTTSDRLEELHEHIKEDRAWSYEIVGVCLMDEVMKDEEVQRVREEYGLKIVAGPDEILETIRLSAVDSVFVLHGNRTRKKLNLMIESILRMGVNVSMSMSVLPDTSAKITTGKFAQFPVVTYNMSRITYRQMAIKRSMDIILGFVGSILTLIMLPFISIAIKLDSPGPVLFKQVRIGKNGRRFNIYKFRSMYKDAEKRKAALMAQNEMDGLMFKMDNDPRVTRVGDFLRRTSLDEFPQFWSVLLGDMTLIGTRPPTVDEFEKYNDYYRRRLSMKPGLTGLWQVSGRSDIKDFDEVVRLDLEYIDNWSLTGDIKIVFQTIKVVLFGRGAK